MTSAPLESIAAADAHLGRPVPLPAIALPLARWVSVSAEGPGAVEVEWTLDDSRGGPGRLALMVSRDAPASQLPDVVSRAVGPAGIALREAPLDQAEAALRPARELIWQQGGLHLRLTAQGPWPQQALLEIAGSIAQVG